jgi:hypothetical protein
MIFSFPIIRTNRPVSIIEARKMPRMVKKIAGSAGALVYSGEWASAVRVFMHPGVWGRHRRYVTFTLWRAMKTLN